MKSKISITILLITLLNCHNERKDYTIGLDGEYFYSEPSNLSYYIPTDFKDAFVETEIEFDSLIKTIKHPKLKASLEHFYFTDAYTIPDALSAYYFYKEDSINYTFLIINETEHIRLNDKDMGYFKSYRNSIINNQARDSTISVELTDDKFINQSQSQIMTTRGITTKKKDSVFWEYFLASQFMKTYSIFTQSNTEFNFKPYIYTVEYGDKTADF